MKTARSRKILAALLVLCTLAVPAAAAAEEAEARPETAEPAEETAAAEESRPEEPQDEPAAEEAEDGTGGRGRLSGGGRSGRGGGKSGGSSRVTPGTALTAAHAPGKGTMLRHGAVALTAGTERMQALTLGGKELALSCGGYAFTAAVEENVLTLRSEEGDVWTLTMDVLRTLDISGIRQLVLVGPESETALDTDMELTGLLYGQERKRGFVSADFRLTLRDGEWLIQVDGREYRLSGNELC